MNTPKLSHTGSHTISCSIVCRLDLWAHITIIYAWPPAALPHTWAVLLWIKWICRPRMIQTLTHLLARWCPLNLDPQNDIRRKHSVQHHHISGDFGIFDLAKWQTITRILMLNLTSDLAKVGVIVLFEQSFVVSLNTILARKVWALAHGFPFSFTNPFNHCGWLIKKNIYIIHLVWDLCSCGIYYTEIYLLWSVF